MTELRTFHLPEIVTGTHSDHRLASEMISAWRADGIFQVALDRSQNDAAVAALAASRRFFGEPVDYKASHVSDLTYSGYIASCEEITAGKVDSSEIFTICKDVGLHDARVAARWPGHGPVPWPSSDYELGMRTFMGAASEIGEKLLRLTAIGLELDDVEAFTRLTVDGWHHMRVLRFPEESQQTARGIGAHTDYGLLVIAAQDEVGGLYIRPPVEGEERKRNWLASESSAGMYENDEPWTYVAPVPDVVTVFPGDILQFMTDGLLLSTPHKVRLNTRERFALAYFHEPNFEAVVHPLLRPADGEYIHYGTHFTNMFTRSYPDRITTKRILAEDRLSVLEELRREAVQVQGGMRV